eukprot:gene6143-26240_t
MVQPRAAIGVLLALAVIAVAENGDPCQDLLGAGGFLQFAAANGIVAAEDCKDMTEGGSIVCDLSCAAGHMPVDSNTNLPIAGATVVEMHCPTGELVMVDPSTSDWDCDPSGCGHDFPIGKDTGYDATACFNTTEGGECVVQCLDGFAGDAAACVIEERVQDGSCVACVGDTVNAAGDVPKDGDTTCDANPCDANPCQNDATCDGNGNGFTCDCTGTGFFGIAACVIEERVQDGSCVACVGDTVNAAGDVPKDGDTTCDANPCDANPCQNDATCDGNGNGFTCDCTGTGFFGNICDANIDDCAGNLCQNSATCIDAVNEYSCACGTSGFEGEFCGVPKAACLENSFVQDGSCSPCAAAAPGSVNEAGDLPTDGDSECMASINFDDEFVTAIVMSTGCVADGPTCAFVDSSQDFQASTSMAASMTYAPAALDFAKTTCSECAAGGSEYTLTLLFGEGEITNTTAIVGFNVSVSFSRRRRQYEAKKASVTLEFLPDANAGRYDIPIDQLTVGITVDGILSVVQAFISEGKGGGGGDDCDHGKGGKGQKCKSNKVPKSKGPKSQKSKKSKKSKKGKKSKGKGKNKGKKGGNEVDGDGGLTITVAGFAKDGRLKTSRKATHGAVASILVGVILTVGAVAAYKRIPRVNVEQAEADETEELLLSYGLGGQTRYGSDVDEGGFEYVVENYGVIQAHD